MKKKCLFFMMAFGAIQTYAQNAGNTEVNPAQKFANRKGTVMEKRFDEVGKIGLITVQLEYMTDLNTSDKMQCIRFDFQNTNNTPGPSALLDSNEVNGLLGFLKYITTKVIDRPPVDPNTEISFTDSYNMEIGCFWQKTSGWTVYIRTEADNPSTETDIYQVDINGLSRMFAQAKSEMQKN